MAFYKCCCEKSIVSTCVFLILLLHLLIYFLFESFGELGKRDKPLMKTDISLSVKVWSERLWIMFLLYWEVYDLIVVAVNFLNEDMHWFWGKRTLIDDGVYIRLNGGVTLRLLLLSQCGFAFWDILVPVCSWLGWILSISCVCSIVTVVSKYSRDQYRLRN